MTAFRWMPNCGQHCGKIKHKRASPRHCLECHALKAQHHPVDRQPADTVQ